MGKVQAKKYPALPLKARSGLGRKLSLSQRSFVLDLLAQGQRPSAVREKLRREQGVEVSLPTICGYVTSHREELAQRRREWNKGLDKVHLRHRRARVEELARAYSLLLRECYREMCGECLGAGIRRISGHRTVRCSTCKGRKWVLPKDAVAYDLGDDGAATAPRLGNVPAPPGMSLEAWDRMAAILKQIREEVGDARPERPEAADALLAAAQAAERQAYAEQIKRMTSEQFIEALKQLGAGREAKTTKQLTGSGGDNESGKAGGVSGGPSKEV